MAQADQTIQNATFPAVRADINNNLAALFSANSGSTAPSVTVAFQDWIDTSGADAVWKKRNAANNAWITLGTIDGNEIAFEGTLPDQTGNSGKYLSTDGTDASWAVLALGATLQTFTSSGTFTPTVGKTSFLVFCTGGGGGGGGAERFDSESSAGRGGGGGGGGTAVRMYTSAEMGSTAAVTVGAAGSAGSSTPGNGGTGGTSTFNPDGSGLTITGAGGSGGGAGDNSTDNGGGGGGATSGQFTTNGQRGGKGNEGAVNTSGGGGTGGLSFWASGRGAGGPGADCTNVGNRAGTAGTGGGIFILEF
jgi:hypothetical protein